MSDPETSLSTYELAQWRHWRPRISRVVARPRMSSLLQHTPVGARGNTQTDVSGSDVLTLVIFRRAGAESFGRVDNVDIRFRPRPWNMFVLPAYCPSFWDSQPEIVDGVFHLHLETRLIAEAARDQSRALNASLIRPQFCNDDAFLSTLVHRIDDALCEGAPPRLMWDHFAGVLAAHLVTLDGKGRSADSPPVVPVDWRLRRAVEYLEARLTDDVGIEEVAGAVGVTATHLTNLFRAGMGLPPHRWLMHRRLERACELLGQPHLPITDIAHRCGFASSQHLAAVFQKRLGVTPSSYRRARLP